MRVSRQEYWSGLPSSRGSSNPGLEPGSLLCPALAGRFFTTNATWKVQSYYTSIVIFIMVLYIYTFLQESSIKMAKQLSLLNGLTV